jgi:hypothetical protein
LLSGGFHLDIRLSTGMWCIARQGMRDEPADVMDHVQAQAECKIYFACA